MYLLAEVGKAGNGRCCTVIIRPSTDTQTDRQTQRPVKSTYTEYQPETVRNTTLYTTLCLKKVPVLLFELLPETLPKHCARNY